MTAYISRDDSYALEHHGVKGMKWGVRKHYGRLGSVERLSNKQAYINQQIKRKNSGTRGQQIANIYRRGRIAQIESRKSVRSTRKEFMANKTKGNAKKLAKNYAKHQVKILLGGGTLSGTMIRGYAKTEKGARQIKLGKALAQETVSTASNTKAGNKIKQSAKNVKSGAKEIKERAYQRVN